MHTKTYTLGESAHKNTHIGELNVNKCIVSKGLCSRQKIHTTFTMNVNECSCRLLQTGTETEWEKKNEEPKESKIDRVIHP